MYCDGLGLWKLGRAGANLKEEQVMLWDGPKASIVVVHAH